MANNEYFSRIIHKHDLEANWIKAATNSNFIPKQGEIIVYDRDDNHDYERIKIGDGITNVTNLPFIDKTLADLVGTKNDATTTDTAFGRIAKAQAAAEAAQGAATNAASNSYINASISGKTITLTKGDGTTKTLTTQDTVYTLPVATSSTLGGVKVGSNITNSSGAISLTKTNVTSALGYTPPTTDTNTTYTFATGDSNGQIKITPSSGSATNVSVKGLGTAAYTASTAYATAAQGTLASNAMPKAGGTFTGNVRAIDSNRNTSGGCLRNILVVDSTGNTLQSTNRIVMYRK